MKDKDISRTNQTNKRVKTHRKSTKIVVFKMERISKIKIKIQFKIKNLIARMHRIVQKILRASRNRKINIQNSLKGNKRKTYQRWRDKLINSKILKASKNKLVKILSLRKISILNKINNLWSNLKIIKICNTLIRLRTLKNVSHRLILVWRSSKKAFIKWAIKNKWLKLRLKV